MLLSDEGPTLETIDFTIRIGSTHGQKWGTANGVDCGLIGAGLPTDLNFEPKKQNGGSILPRIK